MKTTQSVLTAVCLAAITLVPASHLQAAPPVTSGAPSFADFDRDKNNIITPAELNEFRSERQAAIKNTGRLGRGMSNAPDFSQIDTNNDGGITLEEHNAFRMDRRASRGGGMGRKSFSNSSGQNNAVGLGQGRAGGRGNGRGSGMGGNK